MQIRSFYDLLKEISAHVIWFFFFFFFSQGHVACRNLIYPDRASFFVHAVQKKLPTKKGVTYITRLHTALHLFPVMITFPLNDL